MLTHIEGMINQIEDKVAFIDMVNEAIRKRVGHCILYLDMIPKYAAALVAIDADTMRWCMDSFEGTHNQNEVILIANGKKKAVQFDLPGTRHLLLRIHALLLSVVVPMRDIKWFERKQICDNLLAVLSSLANTEENSTSNGKGKGKGRR